MDYANVVGSAQVDDNLAPGQSIVTASDVFRGLSEKASSVPRFMTVEAPDDERLGTQILTVYEANEDYGECIPVAQCNVERATACKNGFKVHGFVRVAGSSAMSHVLVTDCEIEGGSLIHVWQVQASSRQIVRTFECLGSVQAYLQVDDFILLLSTEATQIGFKMRISRLYLGDNADVPQSTTTQLTPASFTDVTNLTLKQQEVNL